MDQNTSQPVQSQTTTTTPSTSPMGSTQPHIETVHTVHSDPPPSSEKSSMAPIIFAIVLALFTGVLGFLLGRMTTPQVVKTTTTEVQNAQPTVFSVTEEPTATVQPTQASEQTSSNSAQGTTSNPSPTQ